MPINKLVSLKLYSVIHVYISAAPIMFIIFPGCLSGYSRLTKRTDIVTSQRFKVIDWDRGGMLYKFLSLHAKTDMDGSAEVQRQDSANGLGILNMILMHDYCLSRATMKEEEGIGMPFMKDD